MKIEEGDIVMYWGKSVFGPSVVSYIDENVAYLDGVVGELETGFCYNDRDEETEEVLANEFSCLRILHKWHERNDFNRESGK